jgi:hypothetical protein
MLFVKLSFLIDKIYECVFSYPVPSNLSYMWNFGVYLTPVVGNINSFDVNLMTVTQFVDLLILYAKNLDGDIVNVIVVIGGVVTVALALHDLLISWGGRSNEPRVNIVDGLITDAITATFEIIIRVIRWYIEVIADYINQPKNKPDVKEDKEGTEGKEGKEGKEDEEYDE